MADDWQVGDLAVRIHRRRVVCKCGRYYTGASAPSVGVVVGFGCCSDDVPGWYCTEPTLAFEGGSGAHPARYKKLRPHAPDAEDRRTIALLKRETLDA